ncbi:MAG: hypothetical protein IPL32_16800 [Chloracidobacterium sp.]|nr:hypothetical protein [Chloracidobacterium sp.]
MNKKNQTRSTRSRAKQQEGNSPRLRTYSLMFVCAVTLVCGFFFAARQHFSSMDFGMKNSRLRKQVDDLEAEKRRLLLAREISLSPNEIKKAAKKTGLMTSARVDAEVAQVVSTTKEKAIPPQVSDAKSLVIKTAAVSPVQATATASYNKPEKSAKQVKAKTSND